MKLYPLYFLPAVIIVVLIHLLLRRPVKKEIVFPPFHLLRRIYIRYMWRKKVRNILLILVRSLIVLFFILSATHYSCGILREGEVILIDTSYSTAVEGVFSAELKVAQEIYTRKSDVRIFECSDELFEASPEKLMKGELKPSIKRGSLTHCIERLKDEGYRSILIVSDGRKEGWNEEEIRRLSEEIKLRYVDVSGGRSYRNAWIEGVKNGKAVIKGNEDFEIKWALETDTFSLDGKTSLRNGKASITLPPSGFSYGVLRIEGDVLHIDNSYYFLGEKEAGDVLIFDYFPSEVKYYDEAYYIRNALTKIKDIKVDIETNTNPELVGEPRFVFILNPPISERILQFAKEVVKRRIPLFISAGENNGFEELVKQMGCSVKGIKELGGVERELLFNKRFADLYPYAEAKDRIKFEKIYVAEWNEDFPPLIYLNTGEPILVKRVDYPLFILLTTADTQWSHLPLSRFFMPLIADIVLNATGEFYEEATPFVPSGENLVVIMGEKWEFEELPPGIYRKEDGGKLINNFLPKDESFLTPAIFPSIPQVEVSAGSVFELWKLLLFLILLLLPFESILSR